MISNLFEIITIIVKKTIEMFVTINTSVLIPIIGIVIMLIIIV